MAPAERFSFQLKDRNDIREPFRAAIKKLLPSKAEPVMMLFTPSIQTTEGTTAASVLVVETDRWHLVSETEEHTTSVITSTIDRTVLVEMTVVLLLGRLKFDFATKHDVQSVVIEFNTVMEPLYHDAAGYILGVMKGRPDIAPVDRQADVELLHSVPLKFRNSILRFAPPSERILSLAYWPAIVVGNNGLIESELSPESAVVLCERELLIVSEEKLIPADRPAHRFRIGLVNKHGSIAVHGLLSRLSEFRFGGIGSAVTLDLLFQVDPVIEILSLVMPADQKNLVVDLLRKALRLKREPHRSDPA
ncbi:MAG TPA: hypothetical protein VIO38_12820 [Rariglobus sp.]